MNLNLLNWDPFLKYLCIDNKFAYLINIIENNWN